MASASSAARGAGRAAAKPIAWATWLPRIIIKGLYILVIFVVVAAFIYGGFFFVTNYLVKSGQGASQVKHAEVAADEPIKGFQGFLRSAPGIGTVYQALSAPEQPLVSFESDVQSNSRNKNLGVRITQFSDPKKLNRPGDDLELIGSIQASSLEDETRLQVFCKMEDFNNNELIPAELLGGRAFGNEVVLYKDEDTFFNFNCIFPAGIPLEKMKRPKETRFVTAVVVYEFTTKATEKLYFLSPGVLDSLERVGVNPFEQYSVNDPQLTSNRKIKSVSTAGPINLGLSVDFPQPLTINANSPYQFFVQFSNNLGFTGNLQRINSLELQVPDVSELKISLQGEQGYGLGRSSRCDFEYVGPGENGFKLYSIKPESLAEVNQECDLKSLKDLAISERQCISLFKTSPLFGCKFRVNQVPTSGLQFDTFRATANYAYKVEKRATVDIYKVPELEEQII